MNTVVELKDVERVYGGGNQKVQVLKQINLSIKENQLIALKGRSGSGKTTLLNLIGALDRPTNGEIYFHGEPLSLLNTKQQAEYRRTKLGFIFQSHGLVPLMTVEENIEFGLRVTGAPREEWDSRVQEAIDVVGLTNRAKHRPYELSGGEQQRVAIARAISTEPSLILADEPTAELNSTMAYQIVQVFKKLVNEKKTTMILTTHDPAIMEMLDYVYTLEDGRIE
ncbi:ABC transporter ATP-binding protein [Metabacillus sp. FJAT-53654]|uniref:Macrolide ABC transporter ATP-binding protein n=3 Tax=Metabacillus TaxID=2675233 RepID=A0A179T777_9BACI|nr:macrolide ABC transporter ATP-binding protein [Metabacillus litoralis]QNF30998.1 ABC transporter ATP-binding protein [Metabacillus sp. KUDC1714]